MAELNSNDIKHLISDYEAQIRRLQFELNQAKLTVRTLKGSLSSALGKEKAEAEAALASMAEAQQASLAASETPKPTRGKRRGRPKKKKREAAATVTESAVEASMEVATASKKKKASKKKGRRPYRLSEYDQYLFDCLKERGQATISSEFVSYILAQKQAAGENTTEEEVSVMIARSLQKLANRRKDLVKVPYEGRGKAYALPEWMRGGKLKAKHNRA